MDTLYTDEQGRRTHPIIESIEALNPNESFIEVSIIDKVCICEVGVI